MAFTIISIISLLLLIAGDQISKYFVSSSLTLNQPITVIPNFFEFKYIKNPGISFGLFKDMRWIIVAVTLVVIIVLLSYLFYIKQKSRVLRIAIILIAAGGIGNLIDRILLGYVVDFLLFKFEWFPYVFNVADCCVSVGGVLIFIYLILDMIKKPITEVVGKENNEAVNIDSDKQ